MDSPKPTKRPKGAAPPVTEVERPTPKDATPTSREEPAVRKEGRGIDCPRCGSTWSEVHSTKQWKKRVVRCRECMRCHKRYQTTETFTA